MCKTLVLYHSGPLMYVYVCIQMRCFTTVGGRNIIHICTCACSPPIYWHSYTVTNSTHTTSVLNATSLTCTHDLAAPVVSPPPSLTHGPPESEIQEHLPQGRHCLSPLQEAQDNCTVWINFTYETHHLIPRSPTRSLGIRHGTLPISNKDTTNHQAIQQGGTIYTSHAVRHTGSH